MNKSNNTDIAIIGAGLSGLSMAYALCSLPVSITIISPTPVANSKDNRTTAILKQHELFFERGKLWDKISPNATTIKTVEIHQRDKTATFNATDINQPYFSTNILNDHLIHHMTQHLKKCSNITIIDDKAVSTTINTSTHRSIQLEKQRVIHAKLIILADGANSELRNTLNIPCKQVSYKQTAQIGTVNHTQQHNNTTIEFHYNSELLTFVPLNNPNSSAIVWCQSNEFDIKEAPLNIINRIAQNRLGKLTELNLSEHYPLSYSQALRLTDTRIALIGETAHKVHPLGAQGFNLTLGDITSLTNILQHHIKLGLDIGGNTCLNQYEQARLGKQILRTPGLHNIARKIGKRQDAVFDVFFHSFLKNLILRVGVDT